MYINPKIFILFIKLILSFSFFDISLLQFGSYCMFLAILFKLAIMINEKTRFFGLILIYVLNNYYITKIKIL